MKVKAIPPPMIIASTFREERVRQWTNPEKIISWYKSHAKLEAQRGGEQKLMFIWGWKHDGIFIGFGDEYRDQVTMLPPQIPWEAGGGERLE